VVDPKHLVKLLEELVFGEIGAEFDSVLKKGLLDFGHLVALHVLEDDYLLGGQLHQHLKENNFYFYPPTKIKINSPLL